MGDLVYTPDYKARAVANLLSQYQRAPRIKALVEALAQGVQDCEDEGFNVLMSTTLVAATGAQLDQWGDLVGEARGNLTDPDYRRFITARIRANNSQGTTDEIIAIWSLVVFPFIEIRHHNYPPATFELIVLRDDYLADEVAARVGTLLREVKPAGVAMMLIETIPGDAGFVEAAGSPWFRLPLDVGPLARTL